VNAWWISGLLIGSALPIGLPRGVPPKIGLLFVGVGICGLVALAIPFPYSTETVVALFTLSQHDYMFLDVEYGFACGLILGGTLMVMFRRCPRK
jgi:hypothetical protein